MSQKEQRLNCEGEGMVVFPLELYFFFTPSKNQIKNVKKPLGGNYYIVHVS